MADHVLFNPGPDSVTWHADGRVVDAQDRVTTDPDTPTVRALLDRSALIDQGPTEPDPESAPPAPEPEQVLVDDDTPTETGG